MVGRRMAADPLHEEWAKKEKLLNRGDRLRTASKLLQTRIDNPVLFRERIAALDKFAARGSPDEAWYLPAADIEGLLRLFKPTLTFGVRPPLAELSARLPVELPSDPEPGRGIATNRDQVRQFVSHLQKQYQCHIDCCSADFSGY